MTDRVFSLAVQNQPPRLAFYPLIVIGIIVLLAVVTALSGFFHRHPTHHVSAAPVKAARVTPRQVAMRAAQQFMTDFQTRNFQAQWARLSPSARQLWPSKSARDRMLAVKFSHIHPRVSLGQPASGATWFSRESAGHGIPHLWRIPVTVRFSRPATAASAYRHLALYIRVAAGRATIVGEGPASIDAPIIMPAHIQPRQVHVPILMYHRVGPFPQRSGWDSTYGYEIEYGLTVSPAEFRAQMAYLAGHGYRAISFPRLFDALLYGLPLPKKSVVLTFDDGRQSPYFYALPVLRRYGFNATFFICAGFAGQTNETPSHLNVQHYLSWRQMATLSRLGMWIEDHGVKDINPLYTLSPAALKTEVGATAREIIAHTGQPVQFVAYTGELWPFPKASESDATLQTMFSRLSALGYVGAVTDTRDPGATEVSNQLLQLPRVRVQPNETIPAFAASLHTR